MNKTTIKRQLWATVFLAGICILAGLYAIYDYFDQILRAYFFR
jgi:hypothetical protein